jgi:HemY protein
LHIVAEDYPEARRVLGDLVERSPDARALTLMAAIEKGEGADNAVTQAWLARALNAPRGPQWLCSNCNHIHADWAPVCEHCTSFDTLSWQRPETPELASFSGAQMLPLITGTAASDAVVVQDLDPVDDIETPRAEEDADLAGDSEQLPADDAETRAALR